MNVYLAEINTEDYGDIRGLYELLAEREPWQSISHKKMPTFDDHWGFVRSRPYYKWYTIETDNTVVGSIYLTHKREVGIAIFKNQRGKGYGKAALGQLIGLHGTPIYANINPLNEASKEFFLDLGFTPLQVTYVLE